MIRVKADGELLDIPTDSTFTAFKMAEAIRPRAVVVSDTRAGRHELPDDADTTLYTGDKVAHWTHPGETGEIVETEYTSPAQPPAHWVEWSSGLEPTAYFPHSLIRVTRLEN